MQERLTNGIVAQKDTHTHTEHQNIFGIKDMQERVFVLNDSQSTST